MESITVMRTTTRAWRAIELCKSGLVMTGNLAGLLQSGRWTALSTRDSFARLKSRPGTHVAALEKARMTGTELSRVAVAGTQGIPTTFLTPPSLQARNCYDSEASWNGGRVVHLTCRMCRYS